MLKNYRIVIGLIVFVLLVLLFGNGSGYVYAESTGRGNDRYRSLVGINKEKAADKETTNGAKNDNKLENSGSKGANIRDNGGEKYSSVADKDDIENRSISSNYGGSTGRANDGQSPVSPTRDMVFITVIALVIVIGLILFISWILRRISPASGYLFRSIPTLKVLGRFYISSGQSIILVKFDRYLILLGATNNSINNLLTIKDAEEVSRIVALIEQQSPDSITSTFKKLFIDGINKFSSYTGEDSIDGTHQREEKKVLDLKNEINMLLNKIEDLKGTGGR